MEKFFGLTKTMLKHADKYVPHISKELVNLLPLAQFDGEVIIVDRDEQVGDAVAYLKQAKIIGIDTESRPSFTRGVHYPTALVQIATEERCYLFRLSKIGMPAPLAAVFADKKICKVGLAFRDDLSGLRRLQPFTPANCIDVQSLVAQYGIMELGLQKIFAIIFGRKISKSQQLTNWEADTLTAEQARYASTDAWATLLIFQALTDSAKLPKRTVEQMQRTEHEAQTQHQREINMHNDVARAVEVLNKGGVILYPTDTVWGIGCDATNEEAVQKLYKIKERPQGKSMLVLVDTPERIQHYVQDMPQAAQSLLEVTAPEDGISPKPLTIIYPGAKNVAAGVQAEDGSLGIRVTYEPFSHLLCEQFGKPLVSTSANLTGHPAPANYTEVEQVVISRMDYVCRTRRNDTRPAQPSSIVKVEANNEITIIRQ